ncbi:MAG: hypothetical protein V1890_04735 [Candidatus Zixiibacteriota bacterium]
MPVGLEPVPIHMKKLGQELNSCPSENNVIALAGCYHPAEK